MKQPPTKTESTKIAYLLRAKNLIAKYERTKNKKIDSNEEGFIDFLINETTNKSAANWRLLKASCVHYFTQTDKNYLAEKIAKLTNDHTSKANYLGLTSSKKKKSISNKELKKINAHLMASANAEKTSTYDRITV